MTDIATLQDHDEYSTEQARTPQTHSNNCAERTSAPVTRNSTEAKFSIDKMIGYLGDF